MVQAGRDAGATPMVARPSQLLHGVIVADLMDLHVDAHIVVTQCERERDALVGCHRAHLIAGAPTGVCACGFHDESIFRRGLT